MQQQNGALDPDRDLPLSPEARADAVRLVTDYVVCILNRAREIKVTRDTGRGMSSGPDSQKGGGFQIVGAIQQYEKRMRELTEAQVVDDEIDDEDALPSAPSATTEQLERQFRHVTENLKVVCEQYNSVSRQLSAMGRDHPNYGDLYRAQYLPLTDMYRKLAEEHSRIKRHLSNVVPTERAPAVGSVRSVGAQDVMQAARDIAGPQGYVPEGVIQRWAYSYPR